MSASSPHFGEENVFSLQYTFSCCKTETRAASEPSGSVVHAKAAKGEVTGAARLWPFQGLLHTPLSYVCLSSSHQGLNRRGLDTLNTPILWRESPGTSYG